MLVYEPMKRPICPRCVRPQSTCICSWARPTDNVHQVLILQHPLEEKNTKNSVALLTLSLARCRVVVGEQFDPQELAALLVSPWEMSAEHGQAQPVLLYPGEQVPKLSLSSPAIRLVVLDATWRKSRKMLYLNPQLALLPRLSLESLSPSRYVIRKAQRPEQRSSLEATCAALALLEPRNNEKYSALLAGFDGFVGAINTRIPSRNSD